MDGSKPSAPQTLTPKQIRALRKGARLSQRDFALFLGVSASTPGRWERGENLPRGLQMKALLEAVQRLQGIKKAFTAIS